MFVSYILVGNLNSSRVCCWLMQLPVPTTTCLQACCGVHLLFGSITACHHVLLLWHLLKASSTQAHVWQIRCTSNCLKHGVHSGFGENIRVVLKNGAAVQYLGDAKDLTGSGSHKGWKNNWALPSAGDAVVIELGVHSSPTQQAMRVTKTIESVINGYLLPLNVDVIWFATPPPSFHSKHGCYNFSKQNMGCANTAEGIRSKDEWGVFRDRNNSETFAQMRGMVELESIELQGDLKVGRGDCQHYCMPGPPDISAAAIFTMLMSSM